MPPIQGSEGRNSASFKAFATFFGSQRPSWQLCAFLSCIPSLSASSPDWQLLPTFCTNYHTYKHVNRWSWGLFTSIFLSDVCLICVHLCDGCAGWMTAFADKLRQSSKRTLVMATHVHTHSYTPNYLGPSQWCCYSCYGCWPCIESLTACYLRIRINTISKLADFPLKNRKNRF